MTLAMVGPWGAMQLGGMGADVIHIEQPTATGAGVPPTINGTSIGYIAWNMNKRGLTLDMKSPQDRANAYDLIKTCDVFMMNMRPDVAGRLGVDYETLSQINPGIVYLTITGWGQSGPMRDVPGADPQVRFFTGFHQGVGEEGGPDEVYRRYTLFDATTGNYGAQAIIMALVARKKTGKGQRIDLSMMRAGSAVQTPRIAEYLASGLEPTPMGSHSQSTAPDRAFPTADGRHIGISVTSEGEWAGFCKAIKHLELLDDIRFSSNADRVDNTKELDAILEPIMREYPVDYWIIEMDKVGVPSNNVVRWSELRNHSQITQNDYIVPIETKQWGKVWTGGPPWQFSATPAKWFSTPGIGEHNEEIVKEIEERRAGASPSITSTTGRA
jgi:crotonobetainyl-CoA:carnitine CoA-transferase CaiB-like acyl-CoA transferase